MTPATLITTLLIIAISAVPILSIDVPLPDPASIIGFWSLDVKYGLNDMSGLQRPTSPTNQAIINTRFPGPFGINETSLTVLGARRAYLFESRFRAPSPSFSISFALFPGKKDAGIITTAQSCNGLTIHYSSELPASLILSKANYPPTLIAKFAIVQRGAWNFFTITYHAISHQLIVYGRDSMLAYSPYEPQISQTLHFENGFIAGFGCYDGHTNFQPDSALACLAIHDRVVTLSESKQVFEACRILHMRVGAGTTTEPPENTTPEMVSPPTLATLQEKATEKHSTAATTPISPAPPLPEDSRSVTEAETITPLLAEPAKLAREIFNVQGKSAKKK